MSSHSTKLAKTQALPPATEQPNIYPLGWRVQTAKLEEVWDAAQRENWDPKHLPWDTFDVESYTWEEREAIAYWWTIFARVRRLGAAGVRRGLHQDL